MAQRCDPHERSIIDGPTKTEFSFTQLPIRCHPALWITDMCERPRTGSLKAVSACTREMTPWTCGSSESRCFSSHFVAHQQLSSTNSTTLIGTFFFFSSSSFPSSVCLHSAGLWNTWTKVYPKPAAVKCRWCSTGWCRTSSVWSDMPTMAALSTRASDA